MYIFRRKFHFISKVMRKNPCAQKSNGFYPTKACNYCEMNEYSNRREEKQQQEICVYIQTYNDGNNIKRRSMPESKKMCSDNNFNNVIIK